MDHDYIDERQTVQLYLQGKLPPEEAERFEDHYLDCPRCLAELRAAESLHRGLKGLAARQAAVRLGLLARAARSLRRGGSWLGAAVAVTALLAAGMLWRQNERLESTLAAARAAAERGRPAAAGTGAEVEELRRRLAGERREHEREQAAAAATRSALEEELRRAREPRGGTVIAYLSPLRSAGGEAPVRLHLPAGDTWVVLALDLGAGSGGRHRVALYREGASEPLWRSGELAAGAAGELAVSLPTSLVAPGDYRVEVISAAGPAPAAVFPFQVQAAANGG